ncbi:unnamed protein product (macronuclear) [Paramecium tetraurelia]|uniref:Transmembrane protein n=1 Tax=Paramecium tetraurelia TaxID=5888 RepID=A0CA05_PARTE|nr:uncharacterized protein GSPATT00036401001 [Paramecium tetraurelia]CAK67622.1 unnamed protein product [Paramecium tetraurelia]|eukprot:XP_001435019.1 hypothetical protein (macronuclear) [Paramecium tetraurelia strain d4-2]
MSFIIFIIYTVYCSESTGLRIDLNIEIPLLENQYVIFHSNLYKSGASQEIQPQKKLLANLVFFRLRQKNNSQGVYSQKFDFLELNNSQDISCYQQNVMILQDVQSCTQNCTLQSIQNQILGASTVSQNITDSSYFIVDNTQLPCVNGTFFKLLVPWVTVQVLFTFQDSSYLIGTIIIVLLVTIITIQIMSIIVLYYKLRKYKKKMKRSQDKNIAKRNNIMRSDYQENVEDQSISLQELKSQQNSYFQN